MAAPIINAVTPDPVVLQPGQTVRITIDAVDPDAASGNGTVIVTDSQGNPTSVLLAIQIQDPLTYAVEDTAGLGLTITSVPGQPNQFDLTAPA